ncbi:MAG: hypothetical protein IPP32_02100 [Bacteroidetes bacterium]|nr:hypothetical protein [Bacteroidota bacterium]
MKSKLATLILVSILIVNAQATVRTLSNIGGAQFGSMDAAITGSNAGDTIMVKNTNISYQIIDCDPAWNKAFCVIGIGFNPNVSVPKKVQMSYYEVCNSGASNSKFGLSAGGNGSKFYGLEFIVEVVAASNISNYTFEDCIFYAPVNFGGFSANGVTFKNCVFKGTGNDNLIISPAQQATIVITNCIFNGAVNGNNNVVSNVIFDHSIFLSTIGNPIANFQLTTFQNSIFMNTASLSSNTFNCIFNNNIAQLAATLPPSGNSGAANSVNVDPLFVNYTLGNLYNPSFSFKLQAASPAIGAGLGGSDIGIHNSNSTFNEAGEPVLAPIIRNMTVENSNVLNNGNVNVKIRSTKAR